MKNDGTDLENVFLNSVILIGNRDVIDLFGESEEINSESIILNISNNSRYKITGRNKISDMIKILYDQFSRYCINSLDGSFLHLPFIRYKVISWILISHTLRSLLMKLRERSSHSLYLKMLQSRSEGI